MAAVLTAAAGEIEDVAKSVAECGRLGVAVLPADVNRSQRGFTIEQLPDGQLPDHATARACASACRRCGMSASGPIGAWSSRRERKGRSQSLEEFCERVDRAALNKRVLESLIKCGAMDGMPGTRRQKLAMLEQALRHGGGSAARA